MSLEQLTAPALASRRRHRRRVTPSLVVTPAVVAHRGASGHRPEHTLGAYRAAIRMGVDDIEIDLVVTRDGVLVARHESEISRCTDVATRPEFADRRTVRVVDGVEQSGWFVEDFDLVEVKSLTATEPWPDLRPGSARLAGAEGVPTLTEILAMVGAESTLRGRAVGVMIELKHATHFGRAGLSLVEPLLADLSRHGLDHARSRVSVMSFEIGVLREVAARSTVPVIQLLDRSDRRPQDLVAAGDPRTYRDLAGPRGLAEIDEYAEGIGPHKSLVLPVGPAGEFCAPTRLVRDAHRQWLTVHVWTLRGENRFLPPSLRGPGGDGGLGDLATEATMLLDAGVDGLITDHPDVVVGVVAARQSSGSSSHAAM